MTFTTRPEIQGTFGVVTSTHWLASSAGMRMLEIGGNAFDAATAAGFVLQVVEPHLNGPGGDMTLQFYDSKHKKPRVLCGQGTAPGLASVDLFKTIGLDRIPGNGLLATVVPGAFGAWLTVARDYGTLTLREILEPAIHYASSGFPLLNRAAATIADMKPFFQEHWQSSYQQWIPGNELPAGGSLFRLPRLAKTFDELLREAESVSGRDKQFEKAYDAFYKGFVAERIDNFIQTTPVMDASGKMNQGVLTASDLQRWKPTYEKPVTKDYHGWTVQKAGPWSQGPVMLQALSLLEETDFSKFAFDSAEFIHAVIEAMKLAYADREAFYGDPDFVNVPMETLLSDDYSRSRRNDLQSFASTYLKPGTICGFTRQITDTFDLLESFGLAESAIYEPTMSHLSERRGDTVHIDVIDKAGNMVAATPSGGWLQSSPTIPGLGFCLNSRAQMFLLEPGLASSLEPNKRPRTTLSPTLAFHRDSGRALAMGTPGGDQQDQWQLILFLRLVHYGLNLQEAIDAPLFFTNHFPSSFYPRQRQPKHVVLENICATEIEKLRAKGHVVEVKDKWQIGRLTAAARSKEGVLSAAATPRGMQAYAVGR